MKERMALLLLLLSTGCAARTAKVTGPPVFPIFTKEYPGYYRVTGTYPLYRYARDTTRVDWFATRQFAQAQLRYKFLAGIKVAIDARQRTALQRRVEDPELTAVLDTAVLADVGSIQMTVHGLELLGEQWNDEWYGAVYGMRESLFEQQLEAWVRLTMAEIEERIDALSINEQQKELLKELVREDAAAPRNFHRELTEFFRRQGMLQGR